MLSDKSLKSVLIGQKLVKMTKLKNSDDTFGIIFKQCLESWNLVFFLKSPWILVCKAKKDDNLEKCRENSSAFCGDYCLPEITPKVGNGRKMIKNGTPFHGYSYSKIALGSAIRIFIKGKVFWSIFS